jgi:hypothetical protein
VAYRDGQERAQKFLLGDRIRGTALDVLEALIEATYTRERKNHLAPQAAAASENERNWKKPQMPKQSFIARPPEKHLLYATGLVAGDPPAANTDALRIRVITCATLAANAADLKRFAPY